MVEAVISTRVVDSLKGEVSLPSGYGYSSALSPIDYDNIRREVGSFWDRFTDSAVRAGGWFGFMLIIVTVIINFLHVRKDVGFLWAIPICLFDVLCNLVFHGRIWTRPAGDEEGAELAEVVYRMPNE